jgi:hypothetical protein
LRQNGKASFQVPDTSLVGYGIASTWKTIISAGKYCLYLEYSTLEE